MAKTVHDNVVDAALDYIKQNATTMFVMSSQATNVSHARTLSLASETMASGDFTIENDDSGRKVTIAQQADVSIGYTGTANYVCTIDASVILLQTTCTEQALISGGTVTFPAWKYNIQDPS